MRRANETPDDDRSDTGIATTQNNRTHGRESVRYPYPTSLIGANVKQSHALEP
jgi:hypothetical protein